MVLWFELGALCLLGKRFTIWTTALTQTIIFWKLMSASQHTYKYVWEESEDIEISVCMDTITKPEDKRSINPKTN
jgi:hypothetical protein